MKSCCPWHFRVPLGFVWFEDSPGCHVSVSQVVGLKTCTTVPGQIPLFLMYVHVWAFVSEYMCAICMQEPSLRDQKRALDPSELGLQALVSCRCWEANRSDSSTVSSLNCWPPPTLSSTTLSVFLNVKSPQAAARLIHIILLSPSNLQ